MTDELTERFEGVRPHLRRVAYRLLGSPEEAEDAVQEAWLRLHRSDTSEVTNLDGWLTTVVARISLDMLRSRSSRREHLTELPDDPGYAVAPDRHPGPGPRRAGGPRRHRGASRCSSCSTGSHRASGSPSSSTTCSGCRSTRSPPSWARRTAAARQLASRARRRVRGADQESDGDVAAQRAVVDAFLAAARGGDLSTLLRLLDPDVTLEVDAAAAATGAERRLGAAAVADQFSGRAKVARTALVDGAVGAVWSVGGKVRVVFDFLVQGGRVTGITLLADPDTLEAMDLEVLDRG